MATLNVRLDDQLDRQLSREAELAAQTRSEVARQAIESFLGERQRRRFLEQIARAARERGPGEALALAEEALRTDNEALELAEHTARQPRARYTARRKRR
jgi:predicted transcriptional regulator